MKLKYVAYLFLLSILNFSGNYAMEENEDGSKTSKYKESAQQNASNKKSKERSSNQEIVSRQYQVTQEESEDESEQRESEENPIIDNLNQMIDNFANNTEMKAEIKKFILLYILIDDIEITSFRDLVLNDILKIEQLIKKVGGQELLNLIYEDLFKYGSIDNGLKDYYRGKPIKTIILKSLRTDDLGSWIKQKIDKKIKELENNTNNTQQRPVEQNLLTKIKINASKDRVLYFLLFFGVICYLFENRALYAEYFSEYLPSMSIFLIESTIALILLSKIKAIATYVKNCIVFKQIKDEIERKNTLPLLSGATSATVRSSNSSTGLRVTNSSNRLTDIDISSLLDDSEETTSELDLFENVGVFLRNLQRDLPKDKFEQFRISLIAEMDGLISGMKKDLNISQIIDQLNSVPAQKIAKILRSALRNSGIRQLSEYQKNILAQIIEIAEFENFDEQKKRA